MIPIEGAPVATAAQMRAAEAHAVAAGSSDAALMARAGDEAAKAVRRLAGASEVLVACGPGNNGGDGYVIATRLAEAGHKVRVAARGEPKTDAAGAARRAWTGAVEKLDDAAPAPVFVDALFGTGQSRALDAADTAALRRLIGAARLSIAIDLPSGVGTDDASLLGDVPGVGLTLALGALKPAHLLQPAAARCGAVRLLDIGVTVASDDVALTAARFAPPEVGGHKYSRGMVAVVAGAMPGAAVLAAASAAHVAGYVLLLGSATDRVPHAVVRRRWSAEALDDPRIGAVVIGPGLGRDDAARAKLDAALASDRGLVIDGDALHLLDPARLRDRAAPMILTPHGGEFAALFGDGGGNKIERARAAAHFCGATVVFKGGDTVVAHPDGSTRTAWRDVTWLASAGTGDVLAGLTGALLAHERAPFDAASDAVWLHTDAAYRAGPAFIADDLVRAIPGAIGAAIGSGA